MAGGPDLGARGLEVQVQERVPAQGADWRERPPSLLNGRRYEAFFLQTCTAYYQMFGINWDIKVAGKWSKLEINMFSPLRLVSVLTVTPHLFPS